MITKLEPAEWLKLNAKLQQKKSKLRQELSERGVLKREGNNTFDKYKYFSEAQYKELFTELLPKYGLELNFNEVEYTMFTVEGKQPNGRMPKLEFYLYDIDTGFYEITTITGEGIDKGDKAGYKAYTGALKYFLADKFMVATGDDPERESPEGRSGAPETDPEAYISISAAKKLSAMIAQINEVDQAWWPDLCEMHHISKTTQIKQKDYRMFVMLAEKRLNFLKEGK